ncbi:hypothetical protein Tco_1499917 [Tanacetum coccineum]
MGSFRSSGLNMGVPPCKSISLHGTHSKFDLACYCTVDYAIPDFHLFKPLSESTTTLSSLEVQGLAIIGCYWVVAFHDNLQQGLLAPRFLPKYGYHRHPGASRAASAASNAFVNHCLNLGISDRCSAGYHAHSPSLPTSQTMSQHSDISGSACPEYPLSQHRYPTCPAPGLQ